MQTIVHKIENENSLRIAVSNNSEQNTLIIVEKNNDGSVNVNVCVNGQKVNGTERIILE